MKLSPSGSSLAGSAARHLIGSTALMVIFTSAGCSAERKSTRMQLSWPTANHAYAEGRPLADYIQPTASGRVESGLFGCVRNGGTRFHEAIDLRSLERDAKGESTDQVFAAFDGIVRHVNRVAGNSSYGRYVVIEHVQAVPAVYTLYAHLRSVPQHISPGETVTRAQVIGTMGRSSGGYRIPRERAHLHFEIGLQLTTNFQSWYNWKKFGSRNTHGPWNGMNLTGFNPLAFYDAFRDRVVHTFGEFIAISTPAVVVRVAVAEVPDFVRRYPSLVSSPFEERSIAGWEVTFDQHGLPFKWTALDAAEVAGMMSREVSIHWFNQPVVAACKCKELIVQKSGAPRAGADLQTQLQLLFSLRQ